MEVTETHMSEATAVTKPVMETLALGVSYGKTRAVRDVSVPVYHREVLALIGPSGCGKTTFLRALNRMHDFSSEAKVTGQVLFHGQDIYAARTDAVALRAQIGMVFQKPNPFPKSIYENMAYGLKLQGYTKSNRDSRIEASLKDAGLWEEVQDRLFEPATKLSGGQQQRLCIARAVALQPDVLLMDEPCSALDPIATAKIEALIRSLSDKYAVVIVTHNMAQARRIAHRTAFFHLGEMVEYDDTNRLFGTPQDPRTKGYVSGDYG